MNKKIAIIIGIMTLILLAGGVYIWYIARIPMEQIPVTDDTAIPKDELKTETVVLTPEYTDTEEIERRARIIAMRLATYADSGESGLETVQSLFDAKVFQALMRDRTTVLRTEEKNVRATARSASTNDFEVENGVAYTTTRVQQERIKNGDSKTVEWDIELTFEKRNDAWIVIRYDM